MQKLHFFRVRLDRVLAIHKKFPSVAKQSRGTLTSAASKKHNNKVEKFLKEIARGQKIIETAENNLGEYISKHADSVKDSDIIFRAVAKAHFGDIYEEVWK